MSDSLQARPRGQGALRGIRVVELGQYVPGPLLGMLLADQGADVIKVERPSGDPARAERAFAIWNRGKRSVVLDLKTANGQDEACRLATTADILIENFRPGVAARLGLGYEKLSVLHPGLIYCSLPGFGEGSPERGAQGWDSAIGALTGIHQATSMFAPIDGADGALLTALPVPSTFAAIVGSVSVAMALFARQSTGLGQHIEAPLYDAMFWSMGSRQVKFHDSQPKNPFPFSGRLLSRLFQCKDGAWIQSQGVYTSFVKPFLTAIGHEEWIDDWKKLFEEQPTDQEIQDQWLGRVEEVIATRTAQEWEDAISSAGGCCCRCRTTEEWIESEHARASRIVEEIDDPALGPTKQPGVQVRLRDTPGAIQGPAPSLGQHNIEILQALPPLALPPSPRPGQPTGDYAGALAGVKVLDLTIVLAGPICGRTLAQFGADVTKIDDPGRPIDLRGWIEVNRGKRSVLLDLKHPKGKAVFKKLVKEADVIIQNNRLGSMERLGFGYDEVRHVNPRIVYVSLNTYGHDGPWSDRPGWEQLAQAVSGIQARRGGRGFKPQLLTYPMNDCGTGILGAFAAVLALHERTRTGLGQRVDTGLALTASLLQSPYFASHPGAHNPALEGISVKGYSALSRLYRASDDWLYFHCPDDAAWLQLTKIGPFKAVGSDARFATQAKRAQNDHELVAVLEQVFGALTRETWRKLLTTTGVTIAPNHTAEDLRQDPYVRAKNLMVTRDHQGFGLVDHCGAVVQLSKTPIEIGRPAPLPGADTNTILAEAGYSMSEIEALLSAGAAQGS